MLNEDQKLKSVEVTRVVRKVFSVENIWKTLIEFVKY